MEQIRFTEVLNWFIYRSRFKLINAVSTASVCTTLKLGNKVTPLFHDTFVLVPQKSMQYTYYGHSCFLVELNGVKILFDPFITGNDLAKHIDINSIKCDYVLLSHGHFDHVLDAEVIARNNDATIVANFEVSTYYGKKGLKYHPMNIGGKWAFDQFTVKAVNAVHSSVLADGTYGGGAIGFVVKSGDFSFYYSGDTALTFDMQLIPRFATLNAAFLCIGDDLTMGVEDAIVAAEFVGCNNIIGMHFDTFPFIKMDHQKAIAEFAKAGKQLAMPQIGSTYTA